MNATCSPLGTGCCCNSSLLRAASILNPRLDELARRGSASARPWHTSWCTLQAPTSPPRNPGKRQSAHHLSACRVRRESSSRHTAQSRIECSCCCMFSFASPGQSCTARSLLQFAEQPLLHRLL